MYTKKINRNSKCYFNKKYMFTMVNNWCLHFLTKMVRDVLLYFVQCVQYVQCLRLYYMYTCTWTVQKVSRILNFRGLLY